MKSIICRIFSIFVAISMCVCLSLTTYAEEPSTVQKVSSYTLEVTSSGIVSCQDENGNDISTTSARSSINGYGSKTLNSNPSTLQVMVDAKGWGGMGVTVNASSSWNGYMSLDIISSDGKVPLEGAAVYSNRETYFNNLKHYNPDYLIFSFRGIPSGQSVYVQIWVYG